MDSGWSSGTAATWTGQGSCEHGSLHSRPQKTVSCSPIFQGRLVCTRRPQGVLHEPLSAQVELLVMKALSVGLVKGSIDEVDKRVHMTWVQPRVLDLQQVM